MRARLFVLLLAATVVSLTPAASTAVTHPAAGPPTETPAETPAETAAEANLHLGRVKLPNSGAAEAQAPFLKGLAALHSFWYDEAADLFREAQTIDPGFALAYWGEAMTYNHPLWSEHDGDAGRAVLERLAPTREERAAKAGSERERGYLETVEVLFDPAYDDKATRDHAYADGWRALHEAAPGDREAKSFYALALQGLPRTGDARNAMRSAALVEEVFADNPLHPGAAHYLIHAYDDPVHAPLGLRAARVYAEVAPAANHALHMPSHIFVQLGMWDRVAASNIEAYEASVDWVERRGHPLAKRDFHSLAWLQYAYLQRGQFDKAAATLETIRPVAEDTEDRRTLWSYQMMLARQAVETGQPYHSAEVALLEAPEADPAEAAHCASGRYEIYDGLVAFASGYAAARDGDLETARRMATGLEDLRATEAEEDEKDDENLVQTARRLVLDARIAEAAGDSELALAKAAEAVEIELSMGPPSGPPETLKPAHELHGELLLAAGKPVAAAERFRESLLRTPNRTASLVGAARTAVTLGDTAAAQAHYQQLLANLADADPRHPIVAEAQAFLGASASEHAAP